MRARSAVVLDMDGVLVDTLPTLREAYRAFARARGFTPADAEFDHLNGPSLREIVGYLRATHGLLASEQELLDHYAALVARAYEGVQLMPGAKELVEALRTTGAVVALASSAPRARVHEVLDRFALRACFETVITGDEVERAKPSPDIYLRVAARHPEAAGFYVLEDSAHGVAAALAAGMQVVALDAQTRTPPSGALRRVASLPEAKHVLLAELAGCRFIAAFGEVVVRTHGEPAVADQALDLAVQQHFDSRRAVMPRLFDGLTLCYRSHHSEGERLVVDACFVRYRYVLARHDHPEWPLDVSPLGVSGIALDEHGRTLLARRSGVTEYEGTFELVPSGGIDARHVLDDRADVAGQLLSEWTEETSLDAASVRAVQPFALVLDHAHHVYDLCARILLAPGVQLSAEVLAAEYSDPLVLPLPRMQREAHERELVPTSRFLLYAAAQASSSK